jgi:glycine/D-amino acid oxidase-like deaminating enzyme
MRVAIVGAGIVGAALADRLAHAGAAVTVVDSGPPGGGTSGSSFAWLNANQKLPRHYHDMSARAMAEWADVAAGFGAPDWYVPTGNLMVGGDGLSERIARLRDWGYPAEELTVRRAAGLEPALRVPAGVPIGWFPSEGFLHGGPATAALLGRARSAGARVVRAGGDVVLEPGVLLLPGGGRLDADTVVCCAGWRSTALLAPLGVTVPIAAADAPGSDAPCVVATVAGHTPVRRVVHTPQVNLRPAPGSGLHLEAGDVNDRVDVHTAPAVLDRHGRDLRDRAAQVLTGVPDGEPRSRLCVRPLPADGHPIAGPVPGLPGTYLVVTHSGITLAALLARLVADDLLHDRGDDLALYRPTRF